MTTYALPDAVLRADDIPSGVAFGMTAAEAPLGAVDALCSSVFDRPFLRMPQLAALREHDATHGSDYITTLAACLDSLGNVAVSAARLGVHVNTFRYRLRRLVAVSGIDLNDPDERLVCALDLGTPLASVPWPAPDFSAPQWRGMPVDSPVAVVAFRVDSDVEDAPCRLARMVAMSWDAFRTSAWCDVTGHTVYSVVSLGSAASADVAAATVRRTVREAEGTLGLRVFAGIGPVVDGARSVEVSRRLADDVLRAVMARRGDTVATLDEVRTDVVLNAFANAAAEWPDLDGGAVARLAAHDDARGTSYVETLRAYLDCFGDVAAAAAQAYVHVRTFRYRLRRIEALAGLRLDNPAARLAVQLELRVRQA